MELSYKKLFSIGLDHDFFADQEFNGFSMLPSESCREFFNNAGVLSKTIGNTFIALIEEDTGKPKRTIAKPIIFRLYIKFTDTFFANVTNINYVPNQRERLYFSNKSNNKVGTTLYLTQPIALHNTGQIYNPGDIVKQGGTNKIFECIKVTTALPAIALNNKAFWVQKPKLSYTSDLDKVQVKDTNFIFTASVPQSFFRIKFFAYNTVTDAFDIIAKPDETINHKTEATDKVSVTLSGLKTGRYKIDVNGEISEIYYDPYLLQNKFDGVIEIYNNLLPSDSFSLFDIGGIIKEAKYQISLNNKRSFWKYTTANAFLEKITDTSGEFIFTPNAEKSEFLSNKPIPLLKTPMSTFVLGFALSSPPALKDLKARAPSVAIIRKVNDSFYSDINLSY